MKKKKEKLEPGFWVGLTIVLVLYACSLTRCEAKTEHVIDTVRCNPVHIVKYVTKSTEKTTRIYAVYVDKTNSISELIPVSKTTWEYITVCRENGINPSLGIRLVDGRISSLVRIKYKYYVKRKVV